MLHSSKNTGVECNGINFHECKRARLSIALSKGFLVPRLCGDTAKGLLIQQNSTAIIQPVHKKHRLETKTLKRLFIPQNTMQNKNRAD
jgi:hypothetical protein